MRIFSPIISGSLQAQSVTGSFTGSFVGSGAGLVGIPASGITGLNLSQIATGSVSASVSTVGIPFQVVSSSSTIFTVQPNRISLGSVMISASLGNSNIFIGSSSLGDNSSGFFNTIIGGSVAGKSLTTGVRNTGVGRAVFEALSVGSSNTAIGDESARNLTSGNGNTLLGKAAGFRITVGTFNTTIGELSGFNNGIFLTGSNNTFLGAQTYYSKEDISNATAVGYGSVVYENNQFVLGNDTSNLTAGTGSAIAKFTLAGTGSTTSNNILYVENTSKNGVFTIKNNGNILIGTNTDSGFKLDVSGSSRFSGNTQITGSLQLTGTIVASGGTARSTNIVPILSASANNDTLVGLDIDSIFNTGSYTGVTNYLFRASNNGLLRTFINNIGQQSWHLSSGLAEVGRIAYSTPNGNPGIVIWTGATYDQNRFNIVNNGSHFGLAYNADSLNSGRLNIFNGGVGIGTYINAGYQLDVNGTGRFSGNVQITGSATNSLIVRGSGTTSTTTSLLVQDSAASQKLKLADNGLLEVNYINNNPIGVFSNGPNVGTYGMIIGTVSNGGDTAIFTKGNNSGGTAIRITDQNIGNSPNHLLVDYLGATGFNLPNGTKVVNSSAQVEIVSTSKGFLPPRMTTTQKNAISSPAAGLMVYDTTLNQMSYYNGTSWVNF